MDSLMAWKTPTRTPGLTLLELPGIGSFALETAAVTESREAQGSFQVIVILLFFKFALVPFSYFCWDGHFIAQLFSGHQERRNYATRVGWVRNDQWHDIVKKFRGYADRTASVLLEYEPRYRGEYIRVGRAPRNREEGASSGAEVDRGVTITMLATGIPIAEGGRRHAEPDTQASGAEQEPSEEPMVRRKRVAHRSPGAGPTRGETFDSLQLEDLTNLLFKEGMGETFPQGDGAAPEPVIIQSDAEDDNVAEERVGEGFPTTVPSPHHPPSHEVQTPSSEARRREIRSGKRPRIEGPEQGVEVPQAAEPAPWKPSFKLAPDLPPVTVNDILRRKPHSYVLEALGRACTLPGDVAFFQGLDDQKMIYSLMQSVLLVRCISFALFIFTIRISHFLRCPSCFGSRCQR